MKCLGELKYESDDILKEWHDTMHWELWDAYKGETNLPKILDLVESIDLLLADDTLSLSRLADGELCVASGIKTKKFRKHHGYYDSCKEALLRVLQCDNPKCKVAIPKWFIYKPVPCIHTSTYVEKEFSLQVKKGRYFDYFKKDYIYLDAALSVPRSHYEGSGIKFFKSYYDKVKQLFKGKDIILVTGDDRHTRLDNKLIHENAKTVMWVSVPRRHAWRRHDEIKNKLLSINPSGDKLVILCCGVTATVLAYELADKMRCLDLGHIHVDYNRALGGKGIGDFWS